MKRLIYIMVAALLASCASEELVQDGSNSGITLTLVDDASVQTRMSPAELGTPLVSDFRIAIVNRANSRTVYDGPYAEFIRTFTGDFTVTATWGENPILRLNAPFYKGEADVTVESDKTTQATIACRVANALVSAVYLDKDGSVSRNRFDSFFDSYALRVSVGDYYVDVEDDSQSAYMQAGTRPVLTFVGTLAGTDRQVEYEIDPATLPATLEAADHLTVRLSVEMSAEGVILDVVKAAVEEATIEDTVPLEWVAAPKMSAYEGVTDFMRYEDEDAPGNLAFTLTTSMPVQDVELTIDCGDERLAPLNGKRLLSELSDEQLATLTGLGFKLPQIGRQYTNEVFSENEFAANLRTNGGAITHNSIGVRVRANDRWTSVEPQAFNVEVRLLRFTLPEQPEGYAWSHTLYISPVTKADVVYGEGVDIEEVMASLYYEVSENGADWKTLSLTEEGALKVCAAGLSSGTTYALRARYPNTSLRSNEATQTMERPTEAPNGDFEDLTEKISITDMNMGGLYKVWGITYQNTITFTVSEPKKWATLNALTCNYDAAEVKNMWYVVPSTFNTNMSAKLYQSYGLGVSGTTHTTADHFAGYQAQSGSNAMVVQCVAWTLSGTSSFSTSTASLASGPYYCKNAPSGVSYNRTAGELFLSDVNGEGNDFTDRPTSISFYYTYGNQQSYGEQAVATVELLAGDDVLGSGSVKLATRADFGSAVTVPITYSDVTRHPTRVRVKFKASDASSIATNDATGFEQCSYGATLVVDNLIFIYGR